MVQEKHREKKKGRENSNKKSQSVFTFAKQNTLQNFWIHTLLIDEFRPPYR